MAAIAVARSVTLQCPASFPTSTGKGVWKGGSAPIRIGMCLVAQYKSPSTWDSEISIWQGGPLGHWAHGAIVPRAAVRGSALRTADKEHDREASVLIGRIQEAGGGRGGAEGGPDF